MTAASAKETVARLEYQLRQRIEKLSEDYPGSESSLSRRLRKSRSYMDSLTRRQKTVYTLIKVLEELEKIKTKGR